MLDMMDRTLQPTQKRREMDPKITGKMIGIETIVCLY